MFLQIDSSICQSFISDAFRRIWLLAKFYFTSVKANNKIHVKGMDNHVLLWKVFFTRKRIFYFIGFIPLNTIDIFLTQVFLLKLYFQ